MDARLRWAGVHNKVTASVIITTEAFLHDVAYVKDQRITQLFVQSVIADSPKKVGLLFHPIPNPRVLPHDAIYSADYAVANTW